MTSAHFIYIPGIFLLGIVIGYILGGRAAQANEAEAAHKQARREARRARAARNQPRAPE